MADILEGPLTAIALCWRIERGDGAGVALTSHDAPLTAAGADFEAAPGMLPAAFQRRAGMEPDAGEIAGTITSDALSEEDLTLGRWDGARVEMLAVDWQQPQVDAVSLMRGQLGEVRLQAGGFQADLTGAAARLEAAICPETSPECRAELGDPHCRVDLAGRAVIAEVADIDGRALVLEQPVSADFLWGRARFLSGANCGLVTVLTNVEANRIELRDTARAAIVAGDRIELRHGCDKRFATCAGRFAASANFRGEPHLPGNDLLTRYPGA